jgi:DHA2 family multidrug resistance protein
MAFGMFAVSVALPKIMIAFSASVNTIQWVMTGYLIARAVPTPALGWLSDRIGKQQLYVAGILGVTLCTILCGLSWNMTTLIVFRSLQRGSRSPGNGYWHGYSVRGLS